MYKVNVWVITLGVGEYCIAIVNAIVGVITLGVGEYCVYFCNR
jgi:hypothetical protein